MKDEDRERFAQTMVGLGDYYNMKIADSIYEVFWNDFGDLDFDTFAEAISNHRKDPDQGMFFPKVANLFKQINGTSKQQKRSIEGKAEMAWSEITNHLTRVGVYKTFNSSDGIALAAFKAVGGMGKLSTASYDDLTWIKKEFISMYDTYENTPLDQLPSNVMGIEDLQRYKLEQAGGMQNMIEKTNKMIADEAKRKKEEQEDLPQTPMQAWETGKLNIDGLKGLVGKHTPSEPALKPKGADHYDGMSLQDRKLKMLADARNKM